jgi:hypothetical protein
MGMLHDIAASPGTCIRLPDEDAEIEPVLV